MCGIVGILELTTRSNPLSPGQTKNILSEMNQCLLHRGPDEDGFFVDGPVSMAMRRLKIIDLSSGKQPLSNEDNTVHVVFNGEIYNYVELRAELKQKGHQFKTNSDTEVLVHLYEEEGELFPARLRGMFAFSLWDSRKRQLLLGRDHFGIKPLYWGEFGGHILYASEVKALKIHPRFQPTYQWSALDDFLTLLFIPSPHTAYENLFKLEAGTVLILKEDGSRKTVKFWNPDEEFLKAQQHPLTHLSDIKPALEEKIRECVKLVLRSDVPLGVFLSSGIDSATIAAFASEIQKDIHTFNIFYPEESYSERKEAAQIAQRCGTHHTEIPMPVLNHLPQFIWETLRHYDQPFGDLSSVPTSLLCREAKKFITVALSGDGGDELFGGYPTTQATVAFQRYRHLPSILRHSIFPALANLIPTNLDRVTLDYKIKRFVNGARGLSHPMESHFVWRGAFYWWEREQVYTPEFYQRVQSRRPYQSARAGLTTDSHIGLSDQALLADLKVNMVDQYLVKNDMASMAHSLELRPALLDPELARLSFRIPFQYKLAGSTTKWILRDLMKNKLPENVIKLPKKGFTPPVSYWLADKSMQDFILDMTSSEKFKYLGIFKPGVITKLLDEHRQRKVDHTRRLWAILSLASFTN